MLTLQSLIKQAINECQKVNIENYKFAIFTLLEWSCNKTKLNYLTNPEQTINNLLATKFNKAIEQLISGVPLYRIIGHRDFFGLELNLNEDTLEPRYDTEILVELAIKHIDMFLKNNLKLHFLDIGSGSGAINLALLNHYRNKDIIATAVDISDNCLKATYENAKKYNLLNKLQLINSDCFATVCGKFDLIISNPPYIPSIDINNLSDIVKNYDPIRALDGGIDGLIFYKNIAKNADNYLNKNGFIILEIGSTQKKEVTNLFQLYNYKLIDFKKDYANLDRALVFKRVFD